MVRLREAEALSTMSANSEHLAEIRAALADIGQATTIALPGGLTARQAQILQQVATGASNKSIAEALHISVDDRRAPSCDDLSQARAARPSRRGALRAEARTGRGGRPRSRVHRARPEYMVPRISN